MLMVNTVLIDYGTISTPFQRKFLKVHLLFFQTRALIGQNQLLQVVSNISTSFHEIVMQKIQLSLLNQLFYHN